MQIEILVPLLVNAGLDPTKFRVSGVNADEIIWLVTPTADELVIVTDVIANYDTLAVAYQAEQLALANRITSLSMRQARLQMLAMGVLSQVEAAVESAGDSAKITWEYSSTVERDDAVFKAIKAALGFTDEQEEQFFTEGAKL